MRIVSILLAAAVIFICSCSEPETKNDTPADITPALKKFDKQLVDHFPSDGKFQLASYHLYYPDSSAGTGMGVWLRARYQTTHEKIDSLLKTLSENAQTVCYPETPCNMLLPVRDTEKKTTGEPEIIDCKEGAELTPVPSFTEELKDMSLSMLPHLPKSYVLYVLEAKSGKYLPGSLLMKEGTMPAGWEHGITKGVAVNPGKYEVIYWIEMW